MFSKEKNVSRVYDVYQNLFLKQNEKSISDYYSTFRRLVDELTHYHPVTADVEVLKTQREEFYVSKFLDGLHPSL